MTTASFERSAAERARPAVCQHPAFPAIVATWLAVLLGAGVLILPAMLLERGIVASGLVELVPNAAPPFGPAGRNVVALVAAFAGALIGIAIARRVTLAYASHDRATEPRPVQRLRRPFSVNDELEGEPATDDAARPADPLKTAQPVEDDPASERPHPPSCSLREEEDHDATLAECRSTAGDVCLEPHDASCTVDALPVAEQVIAIEPIAPDPEPLHFSPPSLARRPRSDPGDGKGEAEAVERAALSPATGGQAETDAALRKALAALRRARSDA